MSDITKSQIVAAVNNINDFLELEPKIKLTTKDSVKSITKKLQKFQSGDDQLLFGDWNPKNNDQSLAKETVVTLLALELDNLPEGWFVEEAAVEGEVKVGSVKVKGKTKSKKEAPTEAETEDASDEEPKDMSEKKGKKGKKKDKAEAEAPDAGEEKKPKKKKKSGPSNKEIVWTAWTKDKDKDPAELYKLVEGNVAEKTVKIWVRAWAKGKNLPSCATK